MCEWCALIASGLLQDQFVWLSLEGRGSDLSVGERRSLRGECDLLVTRRVLPCCQFMSVCSLMSECIFLWVLLGTATTLMIDDETPFVLVCVCSVAGCCFSELNFRWDSPSVVILLHRDKNILSRCWLQIMIILHVCHGLITLKGHSKMQSLYRTQSHRCFKL